MSVTKLNDFGVGNFNLTAITDTIVRAYKGKNDVTLSNYDGTGAPVVKVGSVFDNNGALYIVSGSDETPTGYAGISVSTTFYLVFDVSALAFIFTATAPTWNDAMQGWYNGNDRYLFSMYKDSGGTLYESKRFLINPSLNQIVGGMKYTDTVQWKYYYKGVDVTSDTIFDAIESWIPNVGDYMPVHGTLWYSDAVNPPGFAIGIYRWSATRIFIPTGEADTNNYISRAIDNGTVAFNNQIQIMSNFDELT